MTLDTLPLPYSFTNVFATEPVAQRMRETASPARRPHSCNAAALLKKQAIDFRYQTLGRCPVLQSNRREFLKEVGGGMLAVLVGSGVATQLGLAADDGKDDKPK